MTVKGYSVHAWGDSLREGEKTVFVPRASKVSGFVIQVQLSSPCISHFYTIRFLSVEFLFYIRICFLKNTLCDMVLSSI